MINWQVLQCSGTGSFDHEADTREAALVFVPPRSEEGVVGYILREGALFGTAHIAESSNIEVQPS